MTSKIPCQMHKLCKTNRRPIDIMSLIVITGITGKTGNWFLRRLNSEAASLIDYRFRLASRTVTNLDMIAKAAIKTEICIGNITNPDFCEILCKGANILIHIAGIRYLFPLVEKAAKCGVKRFILIHTTGMFSKYKSAAKPYIKLEADIRALAAENDIAVTILRPTMIYGDLCDRNISILIRMVDKLRVFPVINGAKYELQPVCAKDLGEAYYSVLMHPEITRNKSYNLSGGAPIQLIDMLREIGAQLGKENKFVSVPFWLAYFGAWLVFCVTFTKVDYREKIQRMIEPRVFSYEDATKDFGYAPVVFSEGVKGEIEQYKLQKEKRK